MAPPPQAGSIAVSPARWLQTLGERILGSPDTPQPVEGIERLGHDTDFEQPIGGKYRACRPCVENSIAEAEASSSEGEDRLHISQTTLDPDLHPAVRRAGKARSVMSSSSRSLWTT